MKAVNSHDASFYPTLAVLRYNARYMRFFDTRTHSLSFLQSVFDARLSSANAEAETIVKNILDDVQKNGDTAVLNYTRRFDFASAETLRVPDAAIKEATRRVQATDLWPVLVTAHQRIADFHQAQIRQSWMQTGSDGAVLGQLLRPLQRVGVYVPGGTAAYPSTVLMAGTPAKVAGVAEIVLCSPPQRETGLPPDATLAAAHLAGITEVYAVGGAQAVGAMAYGTETLARVDKIVGPGNVYVNLAKKMVYGTVGIDMLAGPSEVAVLADEAADPAHAAREIMAQCEHDVLTVALVVSPSKVFLRGVQAEWERVAPTLPRAEILAASWKNACFVLAQNLSDAAEVVNAFAPEHLHILTQDNWGLVGKIRNAGAILLGPYSSAPLGDYLAGPSHTLPTAGCARFASPLNIDDFVKKTSLLSFSEAAAAPLAPLVETFSRAEGLEAHARAAALPANKTG